MEFASLLIMIIVLLALIGVLVFLVWDYMQYKEATAKEIAETNTSVQNEKANRLSNIKYVVDQVNDVNTDIYNTFNSNITLHDDRLGTLEGDQQAMLDGLNSFLAFSSNVSVGASVTPITLQDMPGVRSADVRLMTHVTSVSGFTIQDIAAGSNTVEFCSKADPNRCIRFPDKDGNTLLTTMSPNSSIIMDSPSEFRSSVTLKAPSATAAPVTYGSVGAITNGTQSDLSIKAENNLFLRGGKVGISTNTFTPEAALHVMSYNDTLPVFKAQTNATGASPVIIQPDGTVVANRVLVNEILVGTDPQTATRITKGNVTGNVVMENELLVKGKLTMENVASEIGGGASVVKNIYQKLA